MNFSDLKRSFLLPVSYLIISIFIFSSTASAADVQVQLDNSGNPGLSISTSTGVGVDRIDSNGNVGIGTTTAMTLLYVSPSGMPPTYATAADAYIQNNLEVDGTVYLSNIQATGGYSQSGNSLNIFSGNLGIGTNPSNSALSVLGGASFGSFATMSAPAGGIITSGNIGIGSSAPGAALDVQGRVRTSAFTMSGQTPISGYVLTATDSSGDATWSTPGLVGGWTVSGNNVYETNMGNVGIGTSTVSGGALVVTNGNVGIGTWAPGELLDVIGETRTTAFTMSGQTPISGYVLTASDSSGDTTWASPGTVGGWTVSGNNVYETNSGNVGIGTTSIDQGALLVTNGNVGIGTWAPNALFAIGANAFTVNGAGAITAVTGISTSGAYTQSGNGANTLSGVTTFSAAGTSASFVGNVGIGSTAPGQALDVNGTIRTINFTMSGQTPISGYVLTASDSSGDTTWSSPGTVGGWTVSGNNVYETSSGNVGIGTSSVTQGALLVTNGNVGIGTWAPNALFAIGANAFTVNGAGAITAVTGISTSGAYTQSGNGANTLSGVTTFSAAGTSASFVGNVGIGSTAPGQALDVNGTIRTINFTMSGQTPISGYVLTASDSSGDTTWSSPGTVGGWTVSGNNVYETSSGNVGIGTSSVTQGALLVTNGNVGIGTWAPNALFAIGANAFTVNGAGAITAVTGISTSGAYTQSGNGANTLSGVTTFSAAGTSASFVGNVGIGSTAPGQALDVNGTIRTINFTMSGQTPISGYVLTASDSSGDTTWSSPGTVGGWTVSGNNVYETSSGNVGIGTSMVNQAALVVTNGNVGIGTWTAGNQLSVVGAAAIGSTIYTNTPAPSNGLIVSGNVGLGTWVPNAALAVGSNAFTVNSAGTITATTGITTSGAYTQSGNGANTLSGVTTFSAAGTSASFVGNVGIGSTAPGQALDINGTVRTLNFTMSGQTPVSGYVLSASDSNGDATWSSLSQISGWTVSGNNIYETSSGNVGIGTSSVTQGALLVTNGNVGIGTWAPNALFAIGANAFTVNSSGTITAVTGISTSGAYTQSGNGANTLSGVTTFSAAGTSASFVGNVGIGSTAPGQALDINGTVRTLNFTMSGQTPISGYVLTASDSSGDTTWSSPGDVGGWTVSGNNVYETSSGNVGIGTSNVTQGALLVTNGNVGIGTWAPNALFAIGANAFTVNGAGAITAVTGISTSGAYTQTGNGINAFTGNIGVGTTAPQGSLVITNGNVGIGTWAPTSPLTIGANAFTVNSAGTITAVTGITTTGAYIQSGNGANTLSGVTTFSAAGTSASFVGNVGIGSTAPGQALDVNGTIRTINFTMSGQTPISGYVLTASDSSGDTTWSSPGDVSGWTVSGNNVYETSFGNVGIGTSSVTQGALLVTNGNVGIGTWAPNALFAVGANAFTVNNAGAITAVTGITTTGAYIQTGTGINAFTGNIGVGTTTPQASFVVTNGNVGIGTWTAAGGNLIINGGGNVGIGTAWPGTKLDVNGTVRTIGFTMSGQTPISGYVLTASDSSGDTTWSSPGTVGGWTVSGNNVYETSSGNVGIGTSSVTQGALLVTNGNVGIGTWAPNALFAVGANAFTVNNAGAITAVTGITTTGAYTQTGTGINAFTGNIGVGTTTPQASFVVTNGNVGIGTWTAAGGNLIINGGGNVGIGTAWPGQRLDINGTVRTIGFTMSGQTPISGYVLTASDSSGDTTWSSPGTVGGWTVSGNNVYETSSGNVGIGTSTVTQGALLVTNGNVGIGTWAPNALFAVGANAFTVNNAGAITAVTGITTTGAYTQTGNGINAFTGNIGVGTTTPQGSLVVTNGNVGIGTWSPINSLDVNNNEAIGANYAGVKTAPPNGLIVQGNVGFGTFSPQTGLAVLGNVGIGTWTAANGKMIVMGGNVGIGTFNPPVLFAAGVGSPKFATAPDDAYFGHDVEVEGVLYATTVVGAQVLSGDFDLGGYFITSKDGTGNGTVLLSGGTGADSTDLVVAPNHFVGIGTTTPGSRLTVDGGESIGTSLSYLTTLAPPNGLMVQGNVGIGSTAPGQALDVNGTVRTIGFTMSGQTPISGYVLTASDSSGDTTWSSPGTVGGWTVSGNNVYETSSGNVGIGTSSVTQGALLVTNGNVGIGTWAPNALFAVGANLFTVNNAGAITAVTGITTTGAYTQSGNGANTLSGVTTFSASGISASFVGNVGIGSTAPGQALDVNGTIRTIGFTMSGQTPISGYVLTASDSSGDTTWSSPGTVGGWTVSGNNVYETSSGNVGIGTSSVTQGALLVTNGNVGIGTWAPNALFAVGANAFTVNNAGAITAVTGITTTGAYTQTGNGINAFTGNIGVGTTTPQASFVVTNGNVGIGTWTAAGGNLIINGGGNVGIGTAWPGTRLDVNGTVRTIGFTMSGQTPISGYVLTASDSSGDTTWSSPGDVSGWTVSGNNVYETSFGNVGIGTSSVTQGALLVTNGNVGIGTWAPNALFAVGANAFTVNNAGAITAVTGITTTGAYIQTGTGINAFTGNIGVGTTTPQASFVVTNGNVGIGTWTAAGGNLIINGGGNVGIGTAWPGTKLDVNGTVRTIGFTMSGQTPISGYVLTASDSSGDTTWSSPGTVGGWTVSGNNVYETSSGNVGIGTSSVTQGALLVTNGNVGIGTWAPNALFAVGANAFTVNNAGAITAVTGITTTGAYTQTGTGINAFTGNIGVGTTTPQGSLVVTNGNVGIGTWAPINSLDVNNNEAIGANYAGIKTAPTNGLLVQGNVGIGTFSPQTGLAVLGNVGIGTWTAANGKMIVMGGNVGIGTVSPPVLFAAGIGSPVHATAADDSYFGHDVEVEGVLYATTVVGAQILSGDFDLGGYFITSKAGTGNGTVLLSGGTGADSTDLVVAPNHFVGIGTTTPGSRLTVDGGESIGTSLSYLTTLAPPNGLMVQGNVGIGSTAPGQALDVNGTVRTIGFTMSGQTPISGYVLTASDSSGDTTWSSPGTVGGWTVSGNNVYETSSGNVGIGTSSVTQGALLVTNGNVGIGTWAPNALFAVGANLFTVNNAGAITAVTGITTTGAYTQSGGGINNFTGNVGLGSAAPGQRLDIQGTVRTIGFTMSGQTPISGYVLTASDSSGDTTWSSPGTVGGWTVSGNNVYETSSGNVGIGTSSVTQGALLVTNGNVGIGTWAPNALFAVGANAFTVNNAGAITAVTGITTTGAYTQTGNGINAFTGNIGVGTTTPQASFVVTNGNVGIGTWTAAGGNLIINGGGNVGIGTAWPGTRLDVNGTVRTTGFTLNAPTTSGYVLTSDTNGNATWQVAPGLGSLWATQNVTDQSLAGGNVGIGTIKTTTAALTVMNGNVGIGTWVPNSLFAVGANAFTVNSSGTITAVTGITTTGAYTQTGNGINNFSGNVGLGSAAPGQRLDINGTVRTIGFTMSGQTPISGYVLTASDSSGDTTWSSPGTVGGWTVSGNNVYETSGGNVGIGTTIVTQAALTVMNGNVGIGTWVPGSALDVENGDITTPRNMLVGNGMEYRFGTLTNYATGIGGRGVNDGLDYMRFVVGYNDRLQIDANGNVGIGTEATNGGLSVMSGNVGIGTWVPGTMLDVKGTVRTIGFTMSGQTPISGYVLTASDSSGDTTWSSPGTVGGWTVSGNNVYETSSGNVGIGTSSVTQGALLVTNGNVGIGTWTPNALFAVGANAFTVNNAGVITAVTGITTTGAYTQTGTGINAFTGNIGVGTTTPQASFVVTNGNVGIGTWTAAGGNLIINGGGNVGIGTAWPGMSLDVNGTVRMTGFNIAANAAATKVLTSDANGNGTWQPVTGSGTVSAGTINQVAKYAAGGTVVSGSSILYEDTTNVGIGTSGPSSLLDVNRKFNVLASGNVGIGSLTPGQLLDVRGTVRTIGFTMSGQTPISGYVLTASDSSGDTTWSSPGTVGGWTVSGNNVYETSSGNVGIGTSSVTQGALLVTNGNVGIGTWAPNALFAVGANAFTVNNAGAITAVTGISTSGAYTQTGTGINAFNGNVGIGSAAPGQALDVNGTVRMTGLTLTGNGVSSGNVLVTNAIGVGTWMPASTLPGTGASNYWLNDITGNVGISTTYAVGIGTSFVGGTGEAALSVMNGNVGIGTWVPGGSLIVQGGNVGIGTAVPAGIFDLRGGTSTIGNGTNVDIYAQNGLASGTHNGGNIILAPGNSDSSFSGNNGVVTVFQGAGSGAWLGLDTAAAGGSEWYIVSSDAANDIGGGSLFINNVQASLGSKLVINSAGNVGIGSTAPGRLLDVYGTIRTIGFTMSGQTPISGYVLTASDSSGDTTWSSPGTVGGWTVSGNNVYETSGGNVGIGTTIVNQGALVVMNGNVGIGTWAPAGYVLETKGGSVHIGSFGNLILDEGSDLQFGSGAYLQGGSAGFSFIGGNVGIGTTITNAGAALSIMNGNVGIGTWVPAAGLNLAFSGAASAPGELINGSWYTGGSTTTTKPQLLVEPSGTASTSWSTSGTGIGVNATSGFTGNLIDLQTNGTSELVVNQYGEQITRQSGGDADLLYLENSAAAGAGTGPSIAFYGAGGNYIGDLGAFWSDATGNNGYMNFQTRGGGSLAERMRITSTGNVGIGTTTPAGALTVMSGNVGIGTWVPGTMLDVKGTTRTTNFTMSGQTPISGYVLTASDSAGDTTWSSPGTVGGWTVSGNNVYETSGGNVGIGTNLLTTAALTVMNGNVGIGTWVPSDTLQINQGGGITQLDGANGLFFNNPYVMQIANNASGGSLEITGSSGNTNGLILRSTTGGGSTDYIGFRTGAGNVMIIQNNSGVGNVGIGSQSPGQTLDVTGTVRAIGFTMSGQTPISGYVLTASDSSGDTTWSSPGTVGGWTVSGNNVYETSGGNVGIGTTFVGQAALTVMNGNVGIGTWVPTATLDVNGNFIVTGNTGNTTLNTTGGNVGIGSANPGQELDVSGNIRGSQMIDTGVTASSLVYANPSQQLAAVTIGSGLTLSGAMLSSTVSNYWSLAGGTGNVGISTTNTVGIGTISGVGAGLVVMNGNVGIGTWAPGTMLDVKGTVRTISFTMSGQTPISGYVLTASDSSGDTTWSSPGTVGGWTVSGNNVYETSGGNVGIGTTIVNQAALTVMNGNVGIGTWVPASLLDLKGQLNITNITNSNFYTIYYSQGVTGDTSDLTFNAGSNINHAGYAFTTRNNAGNQINALEVDRNGNVGIGTFTPIAGLAVMTGNVGIGTWVPGTMLDVNGTVRTIGFTMSGQTPISGYVLTASDSSGDTTWSSPGTVGGWTVSGNNVYETSGGNVGIGTTFTNGGAALSIMNGNVGIGTWAPAALFQVNMPSASPFAITASGNVGIGTINPKGALVVTDGNVSIGTWVAAAALQVGGSNQVSATSPLQVWLASYSNTAGYPQLLGSWTSNGLWGIGPASNSGSDDNLEIGVTTTTLGTAWASVTSDRLNLVIPNGNVGIGTVNSANSALAVMGGNVGIGTFLPANMLSVAGGAAIGSGAYAIAAGPSNGLIVAGNVGVGSITPGQALDVNGTVRMTGLTLTGNGAASGNILVTNGVGVGTWMPVSSLGASSSNYWLNNVGGNVGINTTYAVGIGTSFVGGTGEAALSVMNGNVGIGTWAPTSTLSINGSIAVHAVTPGSYPYNAATNDQVILASASSGNVVVILPAVATVPGREYVIKKTDATANTITIQANAAETIDGQNTIAMTIQYQSYTIVSDGNHWYVL